MERKILELIAGDRLDIPLSSMHQKLAKSKKNSAENIADVLASINNRRFDGERVYAKVKDEDKERARGMKEAIEEFDEEFPKYGKILRGKIIEKRIKREKHLYFGINEGCKLTSEDYGGIMMGLGLSERVALNLYPEIMEISRKLEKARDEERSIIVGSYED